MPTKVLVVDDEQAIANTLSEVMRSAGFDVSCAYSGRAAVRSATNTHPDVLLCDILMPDLNGFEVALKVKADLPACRLIFFSGQAATLHLTESYSDKFSELNYRYVLLPKPIHPDDLIKEIQQALVLPADGAT
jgi:CheY-like chemotaxis protein